MKRFIFFLSLIYYCPSMVLANPLLVTVLMVKNEELVMQSTLQPLVDAGITDFLIYDTGSTDQTIQVTQDFFIKNNITNFVIEQGDWVDFSTCRNRALQLAEQYFPQAIFMLMLDAEWILHNGEQLLQFCESEKFETKKLYFIKLNSDDVTFYHSRLIRCKQDVFFVGKVHEVPNILAQGSVPDIVYVEYQPTDSGFAKSCDRLAQDKQFLLQDFQEGKNLARTTFFLGYSAFAAGDYQEAIKWFKYRLTLFGYDEELFLTVCYLAEIYKIIDDSEKMIHFYFKAFCMRPNRAEPLVKLADYFYEQKSYALSYLFARHACTIPYPVGEVSLVNMQDYTFNRYGLLSATAYMMGDFKLGYQATLKVLEKHEDVKYLHDNLVYYEHELKIKKD